MSYMLPMPAFEFRHPMLLFVLVITHDSTVHFYRHHDLDQPPAAVVTKPPQFYLIRALSTA